MKKHELPNSAKRIILAVLENDLRISTEAMLKIVEREAGKATDDMERQFRASQMPPAYGWYPGSGRQAYGVPCACQGVRKP